MSSGICGRIVKGILISCKIWCVIVICKHIENIESSSLVISQWADQLGSPGNTDGISISPFHPSGCYLMVHLISMTGVFSYLLIKNVIECWYLTHSYIIKQRFNEGN